MTSVSRSHQSGTLYVVAVPIGHPDDVTVRAIRILGKADLIASEDPHVTQQLLTHHGIQATVTSYGPKNLHEKVAVLLHRLQQGSHVALVSDCGSPLISDPGHLLVTAAHRHGIPVVPVPGPSAVIAALTAAGFPCDSFSFLGQLPNPPSLSTRSLIGSLKRKRPIVAFCTETAVAHILKILGDHSPQYSVAVAYDLTKPNEHIIRGTARSVRDRLGPTQGRKVTLVLAGKDETELDDQAVGRAQSLSSRRIKTRKA
ncbi:MAG: rRNA small subunit methyltransferase 1 [Nitrospira sp.]|nr:rRNA small subunit methyltransferase 1 [Nitrospira sp.]